MSEASIIITAQDKYSTAIRAMSSVTKSFNKDQEKMERTLQNLTNNQHKLRAEYDSSRKKLKELEAQFAATGDEALKMQADTERLKMDNIKRNLDLVTKGAAAARREMEKTGDAFSRSADKGSRAVGGLSDIMKTFAATGLSQMAGQFVQQGIGMLASSALGSDTGSIVSSALSSGVSGAAAGFAVGGPIGAAVGALGGAAIGALSGAAQVEQNKDDYFKAYYNGIIEEQAQQRASDLETGSSIAANREGDLRALTAVLGGDAQAAAEHQRAMIEVGRTPPFSYDTAMTLSRDMLGLGLSRDQTTERIRSLANAAAALNLSESQATNIVSTLEAAQLTGKLESRVTKSLAKMGINVYEALGNTFDMSPDQVAANLSKLDVDKAIQGIYDYMGERFAGAADGLTRTFAGAKCILGSYERDMQAAYGEGYNEERKLGLQSEIDFMNGPAGDEQRALHQRKGELAAYRENLQEQYQREAKGILMNRGNLSGIWDENTAQTLKNMRSKYGDLKRKADAGDREAVLKMANLENQAEALAKTAYDSSEWASKELTAEQDNTRAIRELTAQLDDGIMLRYQVEQEGTKGRASTTSLGKAGEAFKAGARMMSDVGDTTGAGAFAVVGTLLDTINGSHAAGLARVPYNGYVAELHEGERVLTASEARQADAGGGSLPPINITGNNFVIRQESDIEAVASALAEKIALMNQRGTY